MIKELRDHLEKDEDIRNALSHPKHGFRCYDGRIHQSIPNPACSLEQLTSTTRYLLDGESRCVEAMIEVLVYADKKSHVARSIMELIRMKLSGFYGLMGDVEVKSIVLDNERVAAVPPLGGSDNWSYQAGAAYRIVYHRTQPTLE